MTTARIAVLGRGRVPVTEPVLRGDDLGVLHGDGLFETMHLRAGRPWLREAHLERMTRAAPALDLTLPPTGALVGLLDEICVGWPSEVEGALRLVCTRGVADGAAPTAYATLAPVPPSARAARRDGITVATLPLGVPARGRAGLDWLPTASKTTSYAVHNAARRWASRSGVNDALWTSTDGFVLEGPTANVLWLTGGALRTVPAAAGILPGTTVAWLLANAEEVGLTAHEQLATPAELHAADAVWFSSSVRGLVEVRVLDGIDRPRSAYTRRLQALLGFPVPPDDDQPD
ncbi:aminotransferase class IV [Salinispora tropica]|uniref:Aminotransferase, class IV n=1 Tax=Salinispora tropica (strain ATCC BAA-916 / DSM 44818 / JCM 13857 / NBRC 105044 / CNB-440) TaxID=369723 RepID=A4X1P6_SALTO|nr:aminotransferase class IV [Salinispora tropica]ABP52796.1 aminotransferase, class IV [Salinispora tropica CNB-440]